MGEKLKNPSDTFSGTNWPWGDRVNWDSRWSLKLGTRQSLWSTMLRPLFPSHLLSLSSILFMPWVLPFIKISHHSLTSFLTTLKRIHSLYLHHCTLTSKGEKYHPSPLNHSLFTCRVFIPPTAYQVYYLSFPTSQLSYCWLILLILLILKAYSDFFMQKYFPQPWRLIERHHYVCIDGLWRNASVSSLILELASRTTLPLLSSRGFLTETSNFYQFSSFCLETVDPLLCCLYELENKKSLTELYFILFYFYSLRLNLCNWHSIYYFHLSFIKLSIMGSRIYLLHSFTLY